MAQIFPRSANTIVPVLLVLALVAVLLLALAAGVLARSDYATGEGSTPNQPLPFSHKHHVGGLGIDCGYCHRAAWDSAFAGIPPTHTCMTCHSQIWTDAEMLAPVRQSLANNEPLRWNRVHDLADYVFFSHRAHVNNGIGCQSCHGRVDRMPLMSQAAPLTMGWCLECHRDPADALRPRTAITAMGWERGPHTPSPEQLLNYYGIELTGLTDCVTCHR